MQPPHPIFKKLVALDTLKTWSLIVTLFGDLDGEELSGAQIRTLLGHIGIKPEAIRVALHRLKSDGWIIATKQGREAIYQMSAMARSQTQAVAPDIYGDHPKFAGGWGFHLVQDAPLNKNTIQLNKNLILVPVEDQETGSDTLALYARDGTIPDWVAMSLVPEGLVSLAINLSSLLDQFGELDQEIDRTVFRLLVLHHWRRIALRAGSWAHISFLPDGELSQCHRGVIELLKTSQKMPADPNFL